MTFPSKGGTPFEYPPVLHFVWHPQWTVSHTASQNTMHFRQAVPSALPHRQPRSEPRSDSCDCVGPAGRSSRHFANYSAPGRSFSEFRPPPSSESRKSVLVSGCTGRPFWPPSAQKSRYRSLRYPIIESIVLNRLVEKSQARSPDHQIKREAQSRRPT